MPTAASGNRIPTSTTAHCRAATETPEPEPSERAVRASLHRYTCSDSQVHGDSTPWWTPAVRQQLGRAQIVYYLFIYYFNRSLTQSRS